jgi:predicted AAA+ superfamily ATPase
MHLYPMNFDEFLLAIGREKLHEFILGYRFETPIPESIHHALWECLKHYFVVGGMPAVVNAYVEDQDRPYTAFDKVREKQNDLITAYQADIAKHAGKVNAMHIDRVWREVPAQLARAQEGSVQKFKFKGVLPGIDRYQRMADTIDWLCAAELVVKVPILETARLPFPAYVKDSRFKLYMNDVGLLGAMSQLPVKVILDQDYRSYKGYFAENYVAQALLCAGNESLYSWGEGRSEVGFLTIDGGSIIPIEVKSGKVTKAQSLAAFSAKYQPPYRVILSAKSLSVSEGLTRYYPLYLAGLLITCTFERS